MANEASLHVDGALVSRMLSKMHKFALLSSADKAVFTHSWLALGWMRLVMLTASYKRLTGSFTHCLDVAPVPGLSPEQIQGAERIGRLVAAAAGATPWQSRCLAQVLVVQRLLASRNIPGLIYLGVRRGCEQTSDLQVLSGHAWLQCGDVIVNGEAGHEQFTIVATMSWGGQVAEIERIDPPGH